MFVVVHSIDSIVLFEKMVLTRLSGGSAKHMTQQMKQNSLKSTGLLISVLKVPSCTTVQTAEMVSMVDVTP